MPVRGVPGSGRWLVRRPAVLEQEVEGQVGQLGRGDLAGVVAGQRPVGEPVDEPLHFVIGVDPQVVGQRVGHGGAQVGSPPRRVLRLNGGERLRDHLRGRQPGRARLGAAVGEDHLGDRAQSARDLGAQLPVPPIQPGLDRLARVLLGAAGREGGSALQPVEFQRGRLPTEPPPVRREQPLGCGGDSAAPVGEQRDHGLGYADDLPGLPVRPQREGQTEGAGQVLLGDPLGDRGDLPAYGVQGAGVEGAPAPVRALDPVEDRVVDVQLRVVVAAVVLEERRETNSWASIHRPDVAVW